MYQKKSGCLSARNFFLSCLAIEIGYSISSSTFADTPAAGLTAFGLVGHRENDSMGLDGALSWLNQKSFTRRTELLLQAYYQVQLIHSIYLEPALPYIPTTAAAPRFNAARAGTLRTIILF